MILDTQPIHGDSQIVDKFGFGWHGFESYLFGVGARWTMGSAKSYFYTRIEVEQLALDIRSHGWNGPALGCVVAGFVFFSKRNSRSDRRRFVFPSDFSLSHKLVLDPIVSHP